jgi:hypothetical protein
MKKLNKLKVFKLSKVKICNLNKLKSISGGSTDHGETRTTYDSNGCNGTLMSC